MDTTPNLQTDAGALLRQYVREESEATFRALTEHWLPLVWSVARRVVNGDHSLAEDIAQTVLTDFAHKAHTLPADMPPAGWLHRHTLFTARKFLRSESRRRAREQAAAAETETIAHPSMNDPTGAWLGLVPHLDTALDRLRAADRTAVLLRYYERQSLADVGRALGITNEAARKRIDRALEKLRGHLRRRGAVPAAVILSTLLQQESTAAPPLAIGRRIVAGAWDALENGAPAAVRSARWWRRRGVVAGTATALIGIVVLWIAWRGGFEDDGKVSAGGPVREWTGTRLTGLAGAESFPPITLTATLITLPERLVAARMMEYVPGEDDTALIRELLPQAEAMQKQAQPDGTFATSGHPLVVLTGPAKPQRMVIEQAPQPVKIRPAPGDPFANPADDSGSWPAPSPPPSAALRYVKEMSYAAYLDHDADKGLMVPAERASRSTGTQLEARVSPPDADGRCLISWELNHMFAQPEYDFWAYRWPEEEGEPAKSSLKQPVFHNIQWNASPVPIPQSRIVLAGMTTISAESLPDREPRRIFLFLLLEP